MSRAKPIEILKKEGSYRADRHEGSITEYTKAVDDLAKVPMNPAMPKDAHPIYKEVLQHLFDMGILYPEDIKTIESYAMAVYYRDLAIMKMKDEPVEFIRTENGARAVVNEWYKIYKESVKQVNDIGRLFGFNPSDKARIKLPKPDSDDNEKLFEDLT